MATRRLERVFRRRLGPSDSVTVTVPAGEKWTLREFIGVCASGLNAEINLLVSGGADGDTYLAYVKGLSSNDAFRVQMNTIVLAGEAIRVQVPSVADTVDFSLDAIKFVP